jgi:predicted molibdopterin-dependent oxidoreductase YjgC
MLSGQPGLTVTEMVDGILTGRVKGWWVMGENPMMSEPNLRHAQDMPLNSLSSLWPRISFLMRSNVYADVILPAAAFAEKDGTFTNSDRRVQRVRKAIAPPGEARADWEIICDMAKRIESQLWGPGLLASAGITTTRLRNLGRNAGTDPRLWRH